MRFAITGTDPRYPYLRDLLVADGHEPSPPGEADVIIYPPWDRRARYARSEAFLVANAALTARALTALLEQELPLAGTPVLILGWGRVGSLCAAALRERGCRVTAADRSAGKRAWAEARDCASVSFDELEGALVSSRVIVNTVPDPVLTEERLRSVPREALLVELASAPGGIDAAAAREQGLRYLPAPGLPGRYAPRQAAELMRDAVYETMAAPLPRLGLGMSASHCTFAETLEAFERLRGEYDLVPILSPAAAGTDTQFGPAALFRERLEALCGRTAVTSVAEAEPLGTRQALDALVVAPCTGNTLAKLANGVTDNGLTMACKAHLRNGRPLILAVSTNDGLSGSAANIGALLQRKNVYFVPFRQDAPNAKPFSLRADPDLLEDTIRAALRGEQLQPVLARD